MKAHPQAFMEMVKLLHEQAGAKVAKNMLKTYANTAMPRSAAQPQAHTPKEISRILKLAGTSLGKDQLK